MGTDLTTVNAARVSHGAESKTLSTSDSRLISFLAEHNHITPFRHAHVTLRCKAPIFLARQLGKHQVGFSWNEISRRYKDGDAIEVECYVPEKVFGRPDKLMTQAAQPLPLDYSNELRQSLAESNARCVREYLELVGRGVAPEQARMVLPQSMLTEWIWTGSLYGWANLFIQRQDIHAQDEARIFAACVDEVMAELFPVCWGQLVGKYK